ncbi:hypothetical protein WG915_05855 [Corynebacterium sp. H128]|uniref:hypothetical protein n=1 Tax=Corynebacterium sp. H128 TaxID=3133427 RepID=UPI0030AB3C4D
MKKLLASGVESLVIPVRALTLLLRHFPALFVVLCLAFAVRAATLWLAVVVSDHSPLLAHLILPLAPLAVMAGLIVALWIMQPSLPFLSTAVKSPGASKLTKTRLLTIGGLLVPFLTVYASNGLLKEDTRAFVYDATLDEAVNTFSTTDYGRMLIDDTVSVLALIILVLLARKLIGFFALGERNFGFATLSAYLEALWMVSLSATLAIKFMEIKQWLYTREVIAPAYHNALELKALLIAKAGLLGKLYLGAGMVIAKLDDVIVVPLAWLTLGAVLFGTTLVPTATTNQATAATSSKHVKKSPRWSSLSTATRTQAQSLLDTAAQPIWGPIKLSWEGLKKLAVAGLVPMIVFCLIFMLCSVAELGIVFAGRALIGPREMLVYATLQSYVLVVARVGYFMVALPLLAAALDRYLQHSYAEDASAAAEEEITATTAT